MFNSATFLQENFQFYTHSRHKNYRNAMMCVLFTFHYSRILPCNENGQTNNLTLNYSGNSINILSGMYIFMYSISVSYRTDFTIIPYNF